MEILYQIQDQLLAETDLSFKRYLYSSIDWNDRLISIAGARGVGKTTLMLQYIKENKKGKEMLYASVEHLYFSRSTIVDLADEFYKYGGETLLLDEIHQYPDWSRELKVIYDSYPRLKVVFSGSSVLEVSQGNADLSRRVIPYELRGLSFREYLNFTQGCDLPVLGLEDLPHADPKVDRPLLHFKNYLKKGYYPFFQEDNYMVRLQGVINKVMDVDLVKFMDLKPHTANKLKRLLSLVGENVPFKPNMAKLAELTDISRRLLPEYFSYMERAGLIRMLHLQGKSIRTLGKADKLFLNNPNLSYAIVSDPEIGSLRETFFVSQVSAVQELYLAEQGDFFVDGKVYEVGGKNKDPGQLRDIKNGFLVKDDIETGYGKIVPLWYFGFLY